MESRSPHHAAVDFVLHSPEEEDKSDVTPATACQLAVRFFDDESREFLRVADPSRVQPYSGSHKLKHIRAGFRQGSFIQWGGSSNTANLDPDPKVQPNYDPDPGLCY